MAHVHARQSLVKTNTLPEEENSGQLPETSEPAASKPTDRWKQLGSFQPQK